MDDVEALLPPGPWAAAAVATVLVVALSIPPGGPRPATLLSGPGPLAGRLGAALTALAAVLVVLVARLGPDSDLRNPAPALVIGLGWPLLVLLPGLVGLLRRPSEPAPGTPADARPAALAALAVVAYLTLPAAPTRPAVLATAVGVYGLAVLAGAIALGRRPVAERFEVLGLLARWCALGRGLPRWAPPRGALAVLAVVLGGAWFERYERTVAWTGALPGRGTTTTGLLIALVLAGSTAAALHLVTRGRGSPGTAAAALLPLVAGVLVAGVARRALISAQLLADQAAGPRAVDPDPLGLVGGQVLSLVLVVIGGALAALVLARRTGDGAARFPGVGVLLVLVAGSAWLVLQP